MKIDEVKVGMSTYLRSDIYSYGDDYSPPCYYGRRGDKVIVKKIHEGSSYPVSVYHPEVTDGSSFGVKLDELLVDSPLITILERREYKKKYNRPAP